MQSYDVAAQRARSESLVSDVYKPSFSVPGLTDYVWRGRAQSLVEILKEDSLPLVVKLYHENMVRDDETPIDLQQPILLYQEVKAKKLHARNLRPRTSTKDSNHKIGYQTVGFFVTFPESFPGYFRPLDAPNKPLQSVADIVRYMPRCFISLTQCDGFVNHIEGSPYQKTSLPPSLYYTNSILEETIAYVNKRKSEKKKLVRCLRCKDESERTVLFPLDGKGKFYLAELGHKHSQHLKVHPGSLLSKWTSLNTNSKMEGTRVEMIHGVGPKEQCDFTGLLELSHVAEERTVVGCTISPDSPRLFEMAVTSEPFFIVALNSGDFGTGSLQQKSLKFVKKEFQNYVQCAKVKRDYDIDDSETDCQ